MSDFIEDSLLQRMLRCASTTRLLLLLTVTLCAALLTGCTRKREVTGQAFIVSHLDNNVKIGLVSIHVVSEAQVIAAAEKAITGSGSFYKDLDITRMPHSDGWTADRLFWVALGKPATKTDADGRFAVHVRGKSWLLAYSSSMAARTYTWAVPVEPATSTLLLSNDNMLVNSDYSRRFLAQFPSVKEMVRHRFERAAAEAAADAARAAADAARAAADAARAAAARAAADAARAAADAALAAAIAQLAAEKRLQWTGAAMRRAGMADDRVKKALTQGGTVVAWGNNVGGQTRVPAGLTGVVAIAAGVYYTVALKADGTVVAWGKNNYGQTDVPAGLTGVEAIAAGKYHTVALKANGTVVAWGYNDEGQTRVPAGLTGVVAIAAGDYYTVALKADGTVVAWGKNNYGQTEVPAGRIGVVAIAAGGWHTVALKADGTVVACGSDSSGQTRVPAGLHGVAAIAAGYNYTVALRADGTVVAWGSDSSGQTRVPAGLNDVVAITAGYNHTVALKLN